MGPGIGRFSDADRSAAAATVIGERASRGATACGRAGHLSFYSLTTERCTKKEKVRHAGHRRRRQRRPSATSRGHGRGGSHGRHARRLGSSCDAQYSEAKGHEAAVIAVAVTTAADRARRGGRRRRRRRRRCDSGVLGVADNTVRAWDSHGCSTSRCCARCRRRSHVARLSAPRSVITGNDDGSIRLKN